MCWISEKEFNAMISDRRLWERETIADVVCSMKSDVTLKYGFGFNYWYKMGHVSLIHSYGKARICYTEYFIYDTLFSTDNDSYGIDIFSSHYEQTGFAIRGDDGKEIEANEILEKSQNFFNTINYQDLAAFIGD